MRRTNNMKCRDNKYHCLCAYLLDGEPDPEGMKAIEADAQLCPKCRTCPDDQRKLQARLQRNVRATLRKVDGGKRKRD